MKKFKEFGIQPPAPSLVGDKIRIDRILNREIIVYDFRIENSKFGKENSKCLYLQIGIGDIKYVVFTGSVILMDEIQKVEKDNFPFSTTIVKEGERLEFS